MTTCTVKVDVTIKNEVNKILVNTPVKKLTLKRYWDSHGRKIWWKEPEVLKNVNLKIISREYDEAFGKDVIDPNEFRHYEDWTVYVNEQEINGSCYKYRVGNQMTLEICEGAG